MVLPAMGPAGHGLVWNVEENERDQRSGEGRGRSNAKQEGQVAAYENLAVES